MRLEFANRAQAWSDLLGGTTERVFLPTDQSPSVGSAVTVSVSIVGVSEVAQLQALVMSRRQASAEFEAGIFVRFEAPELERGRQLLGVTKPLPGVVEARHRARADCSLKVELLEPALQVVCTAKNVSEVGLLISCPAELTVGQAVRLRLTLDNGVALALDAEVGWCRSELQLVGVRLALLSDTARKQLVDCVSRLSQQPPAPVPDGVSLVVADDDPDVLEFICRVLSKHGHRVQRATRGDEALELVRKTKPQMVFLDVLMPGLDGLEVCSRIRSEAPISSTPVVLLSATDAARLQTMATQVGADHYLSKPVAIGDLVRMVQRYRPPRVG